MFNVLVDAYGGDNAPLEIVKGAIEALGRRKDLQVTLVGYEDKLREVLTSLKYTDDRISIINANDVISNEDSPTDAIRKKKDSSLVVAYDEFKDSDKYCGLLSAGPTGAVLTGAVLKVGRIKGVSRPALIPNLPTAKGGLVTICDGGSNVDCSVQQLEHFALMGNAYLKTCYGVKNPRVALLNIGTESTKGNELTKEMYAKLSEMPGINFVGNMEAREVLSGDYDLIVADGFAGNVALKSTEGAAYTVLKLLKKEIKASFLAKIGYLFMKPSFKRLKKVMDYSEHGGCLFIGCKKIVVKAHGSSNSTIIRNAVLQVVQFAEAGIIEELHAIFNNNEEAQA